MKKFTSPTQRTGELGEAIVCKHFANRGFRVVARNFTQKWGEIDLIVEKDGMTHFVEVKSITRESPPGSVLSYEGFRPEDQMHASKQLRLARTIETYLSLYPVTDWRFDVACVYIDHARRLARVRVLEDVILSRN